MNGAKHGEPGAEVINGVVNSASVGGPQKAGDAALSATLLATEATCHEQSRRLNKPFTSNKERRTETRFA